MVKSRRINLALLCLVMLLTTLVWLVPTEQEEKTHTPLTSLTPAQVNLIRISNNNGPAFTLKRTDNDWQMTSPYQIKANTPRIQILLDMLATPRIEVLALPKGSLEEFGLDRPLAEIAFNDTRLIFGGTHPFNYRRYVRIDDALYLTNDHFPHHFLAQAEEFISHALFDKNAQIQSIKTPNWQIGRNHMGQWQIKPPMPGISGRQMEEKISSWQHTWVSKVIKAPNNLSGEEILVSVSNREQPIVLKVVRQKEGLLLIRKTRGLAYKISTAELLEAPSARAMQN